MQIKNKLKRKLRKRRKDQNEDEKIWLIEFLNEIDITYTSAGCKDHLYIGKFNGERKYKQRQYLLWPLHDILSIANSNTDSEESKEYAFSSNTCLYEIWENSSLCAKRFNKRNKIFREKFPTNPHDLVEIFSCNSNGGNCMLEICSLCKSSEAIHDIELDSSSYTDSSSEKTTVLLKKSPIMLHFIVGR